MGTFERIVDTGLGYLGLFLIGAVSWTADRLPLAGRPEPGVPTRMVSHPRVTPGRGIRPVSQATTPRAGG